MRISKKKIYEAFYFYKLKHKEKELWDGLDSWSIFEHGEHYEAINEIEFKSNKDIYNYLKA